MNKKLLKVILVCFFLFYFIYFFYSFLVFKNSYSKNIVQNGFFKTPK